MEGSARSDVSSGERAVALHPLSAPPDYPPRVHFFLMLGAVHTTGINWQSIAAVSTAVGSLVAFVGRRLAVRLDRNRRATRDQISAVAKSLEKRLDRVEKKHDDTYEKLDEKVDEVKLGLARVEGPRR